MDWILCSKWRKPSLKQYASYSSLYLPSPFGALIDIGFDGVQPKKDLLLALRDPAYSEPEDKLRLMLCFYFSMLASGNEKALAKDELAEYERALRESGADMGAWEFAKK